MAQLDREGGEVIRGSEGYKNSAMMASRLRDVVNGLGGVCFDSSNV